MSKGSLDLVITKHTDREGQEDSCSSTSGEEHTIWRSATNNFEGLQISPRSILPEVWKLQETKLLEFSRGKEALFKKGFWYAAKQVNNDYNKLRQLMLVKEFKNVFRMI